MLKRTREIIENFWKRAKPVFVRIVTRKVKGMISWGGASENNQDLIDEISVFLLDEGFEGIFENPNMNHPNLLDVLGELTGIPFNYIIKTKDLSPIN